MERELQLRSHIRGLLLDYCRAHIAEDYVTFTQDAVQSLLSDMIALISLEDPNSITLPVDPMNTLLHGLHVPPIPEEKWATEMGALDYIRKSMTLGTVPLATSKCWHENDPYERVTQCLRPMSPILSSRALRETPRFGHSEVAVSPHSLRSTLGAYTLVPVKVPDVPTPPLPTLEELLDVQYKLEPNLHRETVSLIRSIHLGTKPATSQGNSGVDGFLRSDSPPLPAIETVEVPIFPRSSWPGFTDVQIEEGDLSMEHMRMVDGWTVYPPISSPSPTPSLGAGGPSSQVDELFPPSPLAEPGDSVPILELDSFRMGEVHIPRQNRIGHADKSLLQLPQSLSSLLPQHRISLVDLNPHEEEPLAPERANSMTVTSSMLGQPPSNFGAGSNEPGYHADDTDLTTDLRLIWSEVGCDEFEIILQDGIDESKALLFEVPELPPPTAHKSWGQLPRDLTSLKSCLVIAKGIRPLNLELSWVPFKYGNKVPTNEEVARVSEGILDELSILFDLDTRERDEVQRLLNDLVSPQPLEPISTLAFIERTRPEDFAVAKILDDGNIRPHQLVLTRDERRRISRISADLFHPPISGSRQPAGPAGDDIVLDVDGGESLFEELQFNSRTPQSDFAELEHLRPGGCEGGDDELAPAPAKRRRLGDFSPVVDPLLEKPLGLPGSDSMHHATFPSPIEPTSPRRVEILDDWHIPQLSTVPQAQYGLPDTTSQPHEFVRPNLPDTTHCFLPPAAGRATELGNTPTTGRRRDFADFLTLRGVHIGAPPIVPAVETVIDNPSLAGISQALQPPTEIPPDLIDRNTIQLPETDSLPLSRHRYLASLDLLQKHALCRCLSENSAAVDLIEREFLGGADLILDQDTAILFLPLSTIPSECEGLIAGISDISWRYSHILVVFEAFLVSQAFSDGVENRIASFKLTEPISKSVKKLKRSLAIADGVGTKAEDCVVNWAFSTSIEEAARAARVYGDMAESRDQTGGLLWQERWWLGEREAEDSPLSEFEDESDLGMLAGMNAFAACLVLSQMSLDEFLSLTPQERTERFGQLLGIKRMAELNHVLEQHANTHSSSLPASDPRDSSSTQL